MSPPAVNGRGIDHRQPRLTPAGGTAEAIGAERRTRHAVTPIRASTTINAKQNSRSQRHFRAKQALEHQCAPFFLLNVSRGRIARVVILVGNDQPP